MDLDVSDKLLCVASRWKLVWFTLSQLCIIVTDLLFLQVIFDGEEAVDAGGVTKEFFLLLLKELLNPIYGMFTYYPESNLLWFSDTVSHCPLYTQAEMIRCFRCN